MQKPWLCRSLPEMNVELLEASTGFLIQHLPLSGHFPGRYKARRNRSSSSEWVQFEGQLWTIGAGEDQPWSLGDCWKERRQRPPQLLAPGIPSKGRMLSTSAGLIKSPLIEQTKLHINSGEYWGWPSLGDAAGWTISGLLPAELLSSLLQDLQGLQEMMKSPATGTWP